LCEDLGIQGEVITAPSGLGLYVYRAGRLRRVPYSAGDFVRTDAVSLAAKLRLLLEPLTGRPDSNESVADLFRRKVGSEIYETLVGPVFGGLYASDPADMLVRLSLDPLLRQTGVERSLLMALLRAGGRIDPPPACSFERGMQVLPDALAARLGPRVRLRAPVCSLERRGSGWGVGIGDDPQGAPREWIDAESVVVTVPAPAAARLLATVAPETSAALSRLVYNPLAMVHLDARTELEGLGFQVAFTEELCLRGVTYNQSMFRRLNLYTAFLGGAREEELGDIARAEFVKTTGFDATVLSVQPTAMPAWDKSWRALENVEPPRGIRFASNWWSRAGLPGRFAEAVRVAEELTAREASR
jgi:oxygen-dependent protoporphyrinogen oxidase